MIRLNQTNLLHLVNLAQKGDRIARENLIQEHKSFIQFTSSKICKRPLHWDNDDELSIGLIAFNEAINGYKAEKGANFLTFAYQVINQRLIDYFRKEKRHLHIPIDVSYQEEMEVSQIEIDKSLEIHKKQEEKQDLAEMMKEFQQRLSTFEISLEGLAEVSPKHKDTREKLTDVAKVIAKDEELLQALYQKKRLPSKMLMKKIKVSRRVLERGNKYIIALVIVLSEGEFFHLKHFAGLD